MTADRTGAALLDELATTSRKFVVLPSDDAVTVLALWVAATHAQPSWEHATRLVVKSPLKRCGKTRLQEIARELVHQPLPTTNISAAALVRSIDRDDPPTIILDEADTVFGRGTGSEKAEDLRGILNAGHARGWDYRRWDAKARRTEECPTFAMAMIGGIGDLPDTIEDRAIVLCMRRRAPSESIMPLRRRNLGALNELRDRLHAWVSGIYGLDRAEPDVPVEDRDADKWEPLIAIADVAGGEWPAKARRACLKFCEGAQASEATAGERLLADLRDLWKEDEPRLFTNELLTRLCGIEEAPWSDWFGAPLTDRALARLLRPYGVRSRNIREAGGRQAKGYERAALIDVWDRYVPRAESTAWDAVGTAVSALSVTPSDLRKDPDWDAGTDGTGVHLRDATEAIR